MEYQELMEVHIELRMKLYMLAQRLKSHNTKMAQEHGHELSRLFDEDTVNLQQCHEL